MATLKRKAQGAELYTNPPETYKSFSEEGTRLLISVLDLDELSMGTTEIHFQGGEKMCDSAQEVLDEIRSQKRTIAAQKEEIAAKDSQLAAKDSELADQKKARDDSDQALVSCIHSMMDTRSFSAKEAMDFMKVSPSVQERIAPML